MFALTCEAKGLYQDAKLALQVSYNLQPSPVPLGCLGHLYGRAGKTGTARRVLRQLQSMSRTLPVSSYHYALVNLSLGEVDEALTGLEQAFAERFDWMIYLGLDPRWRELYRRPRFRELLKRSGLFDFWMQYR
jgi:hypothetical protein